MTSTFENLRSRTAPAIFWAMLAVVPTMLAQKPPQQQAETAPWQQALELRTQLRRGLVDYRLALRAAALELEIGMPARALAVLTDHAGADSLWDETGFELRGDAEFALGRFGLAALSFRRAANGAAPRRRGILTAKAGVAFEKAGLSDKAALQYSLASRDLPELGGWLAVREASVGSDTTYAFGLLSAAAPEAEFLASRARGVLYARAGDTNKAISVFERGGHPIEAATLAIVAGDSAAARRLAYLAIQLEDTTIARQGASIVEESYPPQNSDDFLTLAAAARRLGSVRDAARLVEGAITAGDSSAETLVQWGDLLAASSSRREALAAYGRAATMTGEAASQAVFNHGRTLLLLGRVNEGMAELARFVERFPEHDAVPRALYAMADRRRRESRFQEADSLNRMVVKGWRRNPYASLARMDLATDALARGDTAATVDWYRAEIESRGSQRNTAQYRLGSIRAAQGDTVAARGIWAALARADSLGYSGMIARNAAQMPPLELEQITPTPHSGESQEILQVLDLLRETYLQEELALLLDSIKAERSRSPVELLDLAEGLIERGFVSEGIHLGWLASRSYTLNHPRVLRVVFPWPYRDLIEQKARDLDLDPYLLAALIRQESAFTPDAVSRAGAYGLMQLMPTTAREVARRIGVDWDDVLLTVADANLHLGATHFAGLLRHYNNRVVPTLAAYNAGGTPVRRWLSSFGGNDQVKFVEQVPYAETRGYLQTVLRNLALYRALYPGRAEGTPASP